jgi:type I restriction enzyme S subunit
MMVLGTRSKQPLPNGWRWAKLGEVCELNPRRPLIDRKDSDPASFIPMEAVDATSGMVSNVHVRTYGEVKKGYTYFSEGDVLFAKITPCMQNGKHAIARGLIGGIGFGTTEFHVLRPNENIISELIWFFIRQPNILVEATEHFTGAVGQQRVPESYLANLEIPLPPLPEQKRIAGVLREQMASVGKARAAAQARLEAVKALPAAFLREVFPQPGQPLPDGWRWVRLGDIFDITSSKRVFESDWTSEGVPFYRAREIVILAKQGFVDNELFISEEMFTEYSSKYGIPQEGDMMVTGVGTLGVCYVVQKHDRFYFKDGNIIWLKKKSENNTRFVEYAFQTDALREQIDDSAGATVGTFTIIKAKNTSIPLPPLALQEKIAGVFKAQMAVVEKARKAAEAELNTINALPAALLRRAFAGEI